MEPHDDRERRFKAEGFKLADLIGVLDEGGIIWGRDFVVKGHPGPDEIELLFENEVLAERAQVMWTSKLRSPT